MNERFFEVSDNFGVMAMLIEAIPNSWSFLDGGLSASQEMILAGIVEKDTGFEVGRFHSIHPTIIGQYEEGKPVRKKPNLFAIMVEGKFPGFVHFDEAGYDGEIPLSEAKRIAAGFIRKGYRGGLHFYSDCGDDKKYDNSARCSMMFQPWKKDKIFSMVREPQLTYIKLEWEDLPRGTNHISPLLSLCTNLHLPEYKPPILTRA